MTWGVCRNWVVVLACVCAGLRAETPEHRWIALESDGARFRAQGKYDDARLAYEEALRLVEQRFEDCSAYRRGLRGEIVEQ